MVHIYILSYGKVHQSIRASHTLVAKEALLEGAL